MARTGLNFAGNAVAVADDAGGDQVTVTISGAALLATKTSSFTPALAELGYSLLADHAATQIDVTLPSDGTLNLPVGYWCEVVRYNDAAVRFVQGSGATVLVAGGLATFDTLRLRYSNATATKVASSTWLLAGDLE